jgi:hypothetical protein
VTGSVFRVRTLLLLLGVILAEALVLATTDIWAASLWTLVNLTAVQFGYVAGLFGRGLLEQVGFSLPPVKIRRP